MANERDTGARKRWLAFEHWCFKNKHIFWMVAWFLFFCVMPFFTYEHVDIMDLP